jgi:hypothetical protein
MWRMTVLAAALFCATMNGCERKHIIGEQEARQLALKAAEDSATKMGIPKESVRLKEFDDSGKTVRWFFAFDSTANPDYLVAVQLDEYGRYEVHREPINGK